MRGLHAKLLDDQARHPDTMEERRGAWGRLVALFRLIHAGDRTGWIRARGGKLFNPDAFPFLEGRANPEEPPRIASVTDGCVLRVLDGLVTLKGERLSYRTLDVEQIGSVYETVMGFTVLTASGPVLAIRAGKHNRTPVFVDLAELAELRPEERLKRLKEGAQRSSLTTERQQREIRAAAGVEGIVAALDSIVDERGSPDKRVLSAGGPILQPTAERRSTGSHYTPRSLTEPIVRHALEPVFVRLGPDARPEDVLDLKVCDPAMGSGAFLVEACRALAARLVQAWARWPETRPKLPADEDDDLHARRLIAQRCLYGVDKNPMATDLAKLSLWLATLARDHEFTFLDHALKSGDSLVGLTRAQIAAVHWDSSRPGLPLFRTLIRERFEAALAGRAEIRDAPDDVERAIQEARYQRIERRLSDARLLGDAVIAAFFSADKPRSREVKRQEIESWLNEPTATVWMKVGGLAGTLQQGERPIPPFHWELEFPEVFARENPGFDAIVGNPPFAGKNTTIANHRSGYISWLQSTHPGSHGNSDLVAHFFLRAFDLARLNGIFGLVATNTIGQGDTRRTGLATILANGGTILRALGRLAWPGEAAVIVSIVHVMNGDPETALLNGRSVSRISAYLVEGDLDDTPARLQNNFGRSYVGSILLGMGFTFDDSPGSRGAASSLSDMEAVIRADPRNKEKILPYIGGEEVNTHPRHCHHRYAIYLSGLSEWDARDGWPALMKILEERVKPQRMLDNRVARREHWWWFGEPQIGLYNAIQGLSRVLSAARVSSHFGFVFLPSNVIFSEQLVVIGLQSFAAFANLQCRAHEIWARFFASSMKDDLRYTPSDCFDTFPFLSPLRDDLAVEATGRAYYDHRADLMTYRNEGLTQTYNRFHDRRETAAEIVRLRQLHAEMDRAVLRAMAGMISRIGPSRSFSTRRTRTTTNIRAGCSGWRSSGTRCWRACSR